MMEQETAPLVGAIACPEGFNTEEEDLPLVVWLRGDEEIVDEFTMDAEAAMKELGIKRSRLTQISGRELRVGRIRIDRYTRAVYRPQDIAQYQAWTRSTASHQKSSKAIEVAAEKLDVQRQEMRHDLVSLKDDITATLLEHLNLVLNQLLRLQSNGLEKLRDSLEGFEQDFEILRRETAAKQDQQATLTHKLNEPLQLIQNTLTSLFEGGNEEREQLKALLARQKELETAIEPLQEIAPLIQASHKAHAKLVRDLYNVVLQHGDMLRVLQRPAPQAPDVKMPQRQIPRQQRQRQKSEI